METTTKVSEPEKNEIIFNASDDKWVMKITREGILFNREAYPEAEPEHFAECIIKIMETALPVTFCKKGEWISVRKLWPEEVGVYKVKDCRFGSEGTAYYDGYDWDHIEMIKGSLIYVDNVVTHWAPPRMPLEH